MNYEYASMVTNLTNWGLSVVEFSIIQVPLFKILVNSESQPAGLIPTKKKFL